MEPSRSRSDQLARPHELSNIVDPLSTRDPTRSSLGLDHDSSTGMSATMGLPGYEVSRQGLASNPASSEAPPATLSSPGRIDPPSFTRRTLSSPSSPGDSTQPTSSSVGIRRKPPPLPLELGSFSYAEEEGRGRKGGKALEMLLAEGSPHLVSPGFAFALSSRPGPTAGEARLAGEEFERLPLSEKEATTKDSSSVATNDSSSLGLPFSPAPPSSSSTTHLTPTLDSIPLPVTQGEPFSPSSTVESPVTDRSRLIGLGELATPRWTSAGLEREGSRGWGSPEQVREAKEGSSPTDPCSLGVPERNTTTTTTTTSTSNSTRSVHPSDLFPPQPQSTSLSRASSLRQAPPASSSNSVGLGFSYETSSSTAALAAASAALLFPSVDRRASGGSAMSSAPSSRRSSGGAGVHQRRSSASKSGFAHLPPSPATGSSRLSGPLPLPPPFSIPMTQSTSYSQPNSATLSRTPDHPRYSTAVHPPTSSHHSSPSIIAASILRQTRDLDYYDAAESGGAGGGTGGENETWEALRRLDGLGGKAGKGGRRSLGGVSPSRSAAKEGERRRRSSAARDLEGETSAAAAGGGTVVGGVPPPASSSSPFHFSSTPPLPALPTLARPTTEPTSPRRASSSITVATTSGSRDSNTSGTSFSSLAGVGGNTSGTSVSSASVGAGRIVSGGVGGAAGAGRRRGSNGSDYSSSGNSMGEPSTPLELNETGSMGGLIGVLGGEKVPPVPKIPTNFYENYRPTTYDSIGGAGRGTIGLGGNIGEVSGGGYGGTLESPRFGEFGRRPSETSLREPRSPGLNVEQEVGGGKTPPPVALTTAPGRKWSLTNVLGLGGKSPKIDTSETEGFGSGGGGMKGSSSFIDLGYAARMEGGSLGKMESKFSGSSGDIVTLAAAGSREGSLSGRMTGTGFGGKVRQSFRNDKPFSTSTSFSSSMGTRPRTESTSTTSTTTGIVAPPPLIVVPTDNTGTTPARSRSSLLSPRRTPSGIPFFSRKATTPTNVLPEKDKTEKEPSPEGRRSILGLNFLRSTASRREKDKDKSIPRSASSSLSSISPSVVRRGLVNSDSGNLSEFGARGAKGGSLILRKRGKTLSAVETSPPNAAPSNLPPASIVPLPRSTLKRMDSLTSSASSSSLVMRAQLTPTTTPRTTRLGREEAKAAAGGGLETITGSPSSFPRVEVEGPASKPGTPTKIPRLQYQRSSIPSPALTPKPSASDVFSEPPTGTTYRRASYLGSTPEISSLSSSKTFNDLKTFSGASGAGGEYGAIVREPGLGIGERSVASRRRLDSESGIPRSRSTVVVASSTALRASLREDGALSSTAATREGTVLPRSFARGTLVGEGLSSSTSSASTPRYAGTPLKNSKIPSASEPIIATALRRSTTTKLEAPPTTIPVRRVSTLSSSLAAEPRSRAPSSKVPTPRAPSASPAPSSSRSSSAADVSEDELRGDEEMSAYVRRQQTKRLASGVDGDVIRKMFEFPERTARLPALDMKDAASLFSRSLTDYEKEEIKDYPHIYFCGQNIIKDPASPSVPLDNHSYDDERGDYILVPHDHILYRYEVIDVLGKGSFGQVLQCRDHKTGEMVAIKIIRNKKRFHHQALVEIKVLENLVKWDPEEKHSVIRMVDSFTFRNHLCIVTELLSINLYELVKADGFAGFSTNLIRRFTVQILGSLTLLRRHRVVHCDLKPENILLKHPAKSAIKVIDFGSSCFEHEKVYTYIQSRFYRSPEVILGMNYHMAIDMWSLGCILAEMFTGYPIFPGENEQEQLSCIMEVLGLPDKYLVDRSSRKKLFFDSTGAPRPVTNSKGRRRRPSGKTLAQVLKTDDELFVDFINKCLALDPDRRLKPDAAMRHPWIARQRLLSAQSPASIPPRSSRPTLSSSTSSTTTVQPFNISSSISTPRKKLPSSISSTGLSASTSTLGGGGGSIRARTMSSANLVGVASGARTPRGVSGTAGSGTAGAKGYSLRG